MPKSKIYFIFLLEMGVYFKNKYTVNLEPWQGQEETWFVNFKFL